MFDKVFNCIIGALVRFCFRPRIVLPDAASLDEILCEPSILVSNHTSHLDGPVLNTVLYPRRIHSLAAKDRFEQWGIGWFLRHTYCIPIERRRPDTQWLRDATEALKKEGESVAIYPEGRHGGHRQMLPFHAGAVILALTSDTPIVPVYIDGPHKLFRRTKVVIAAPIRIPIPKDGISAEYANRQAELLRERIIELMDCE